MTACGCGYVSLRRIHRDRVGRKGIVLRNITSNYINFNLTKAFFFFFGDSAHSAGIVDT